MKNAQLKSIQILRGMAATWVVVYHAIGLPQPGNRHSAVMDMVGKHGNFGVDLFFVVSGFVIYYSVHGKAVTPLSFLSRRLERIVPPYLLLTSALFGAMLALPGLFHSSPPSLDHFVRSALFLSFTGYQNPLLYVGWTLEYEMFFYVLAAGMLALGWSAFRKLPVIMCVFVFFGMALGWLGLKAPSLIFLANPMLLEFCLGFLAASILLTRKVDWAVATSLIGLTVLLLVADPGHRFIVAGIPAMALLGACLRWSSRVNLPGSVTRGLVFLGNASYAIYLVQVVSLPMAARLLAGMGARLEPAAFVLLAIGMTLCLGCLFFRLVERPVLNYVRRLAPKRAAAMRFVPIGQQQARGEAHCWLGCGECWLGVHQVAAHARPFSRRAVFLRRAVRCPLLVRPIRHDVSV